MRKLPRYSLKFAFITLCSILLLTLIAGSVSAETYTVDDDWDGADYSTISAAIEDAEDDDIIRVHAGTYYETIGRIHDQISIIGNGSDSTKVRYNYTNSIVELMSREIVLSGMELSSDTYTEVIYSMYPVSDVVIEDCRIISGYIGIYMMNSGSRYEIRDCEVIAENYGIRTNTDDILIGDCLISSNGTGVYAEAADNLTMTGCDVNSEGYGLEFINSPEFKISDCDVSSELSMGLSAVRSPDGALEDLRFHRSGIEMEGSDLINTNITNCTVDNGTIHVLTDLNDTVVDASGGQLYLYNCSNVTVTTAVVIDSSPAVFVENCENVTVQDLPFRDTAIGVKINGSSGVLVQDCTFQGISGYAVIGEDMDVDGCIIWNGTSSGSGIRISGQGKISNCIVSALDQVAIHLLEAEEVMVESSSIGGNNGSGIIVESSTDCEIAVCDISNNTGFDLSFSDWGEGILDMPERGYGILIKDDSSDITVRDCNIRGSNQYGISIDGSVSVQLDNVTLQDDGLSISGDEERELASHVILNTTVNGRPLLYLVQGSNLTITADYGEYILVNCTNITIEGRNFTGTDTGMMSLLSSFVNIYNCSFEGMYESIVLFETHYVSIENCTFDGSVDSGAGLGFLYGYFLGEISMTSSSVIDIIDCSFRDSGDVSIKKSGGRINVVNCDIEAPKDLGIYTQEGYPDSFSGVTINGSLGSGIYLYSNGGYSVIDSKVTNSALSGFSIGGSSIKIENCTAKDNNGTGFAIWSEWIRMQNCTSTHNGQDGISFFVHSFRERFWIQDSTSSNNGGNGLYARGREHVIERSNFKSNGGNGIVTDQVSSSRISECTISKNDGAGINMTHSGGSFGRGNVVSDNDISENTDHGLFVHYSDHNRFYGNEIMWNRNGTDRVQAFERGFMNTWSNGSSGNRWSDYNGVDLNSDGIGDVPYPVPEIGSHDDHPLGGGTGTYDITLILPKKEVKIGEDVNVTVNITLSFDWPNATVQILEDGRVYHTKVVDLVSGSNEVLFYLVFSEGEYDITARIKTVVDISDTKEIDVESEVEASDVVGSPFFAILILVLAILGVHYINLNMKAKQKEK